MIIYVDYTYTYNSIGSSIRSYCEIRESHKEKNNTCMDMCMRSSNLKWIKSKQIKVEKDSLFMNNQFVYDFLFVLWIKSFLVLEKKRYILSLSPFAVRATRLRAGFIVRRRRAETRHAIHYAGGRGLTERAGRRQRAGHSLSERSIGLIHYSTEKYGF